jgi:uncharacterized SAM-binding protein YcdF (DUF218 family)
MVEISVFFYASKIMWFVLQPSSMLLLILAFGLLLYRLGRTTFAIRLLAGAVVIYAIGGLTPVSNALMLSLEQHYPRPDAQNAGPIDGIIVLGGVIDGLVSSKGGEIALNEAAERLTEAAALAYRYPKARIVLSGGDGALLYESGDEASYAKEFFTRIGIDPARITLERKSRNTWENAVYSRERIQPQPGERWLLVTSAFHMHRAMGVFRAAGFPVTPWPVDYRTRGPEDLWRVPPRPSEGWKRIDMAVREWVGYVAYWATGRLK